MGRDVLDLREVDRSQVAVAGGKGALLGELMRVEGTGVPPGFCVTTHAFRRVVLADPSVAGRLAGLAEVDPDDGEAVAAAGAELRRTIEAVALPDELARAVAGALDALGEGTRVAVRSSATTEDRATASAAGQQESFLDVVGPAAVLAHVRRCWASLFTERAIAYRRHLGADDGAPEMAVVVQRMVPADAAGVLFTAHPTTGHRRIARVEAVPGLADALVGGAVDPEAWEVHDGAVTSRTAATPPVLAEDQVLRLDALGRRVAAHLGHPQDVEWCLADDVVHLVQTRPITTLFPIPPSDDGQVHVYVSVGHQQMMTDPIKPLGLSIWQLTAARPMHVAGGRLFVDVTRELASPATRDAVVQALGRSDPLIGDALRSLVERDGFLPPPPEDPPAPPPGAAGGPAVAVETDPAVVARLVAGIEAQTAAAAEAVRSRTGAALLDAIEGEVAARGRDRADPQGMQVIMAGVEARWWLDDHLEEWLGERGAVDVLSQAVPGNVTSEMGLALLDVADAVRPHPEVVAFLADAHADDDLLDRLPDVAGGQKAHAALVAFLDRYGMRGLGEIDITRPRWAERPQTLVPLILGHVRSFPPGEAARRLARGRREAEATAVDVLDRLRALPDGEQKAAEAERMIERLRTFSGYREHPKYGIVCRYAIYRRALLEEADRLVDAGLLTEPEDLFFLFLPEIRAVVGGRRADDDLIRRRREEWAAYAALTPPRVLTSDGEAVAGSYRRHDVPEGALVGLAVSTGVVEGRARVLADMGGAAVEDGDILVTAHTDPSWSPLFVSIAGLVTEVGGLMTHGAVVAREYGLPAVVGVAGATRLIRDGQRIRVDGTRGHVELVGDEDAR